MYKKECFDKNLLKVLDGNNQESEFKYNVLDKALKKFIVKVQLPEGRSL